MRYTVDERHERILELVRESGSLRVTDLAARLGISTVTARRDVETLATRGRLHRVRGAVSWPGAPTAPAPALLAETPPRAVLADAADLMLGMVVPQAPHYFGEVIRGAQAAASAAGARIVLGFSGYLVGKDVAEAERMRDAGAHGLLLTPSWLARGSDQDSDMGGGRLDFGLPTVLVERRGQVGSAAAELDRVCSDHAGGAGLAVRHLAGLGHQKIALVAGLSPTSLQLREGYEAALRSLGLPSPPVRLSELYEGKIDLARLDAAADSLADAVRRGEVSAALVLSDADAIMLLQGLRKRDVRVPDDLALVAYDDDVAALSDLPLTAVAPPKYEVGHAAARLLLQRLGEPGQAAPRYHLDLVPELRVRASCGARQQAG